jgi:tetratricopeptide (TPR) repeat protein
MKNVVSILILGFAGVVTAAEVDLSLNSMDATLSKVAAHAQSYPPNFSSASERQQIERVLKSAIVVLDAAVVQYPAEADLWFRDGYANAMGHNLDFPGCDRQFVKAFKRFLALRPNDKKGNFYFGAFLAGTAGGQKDCVPYLKKAIDLGVTDAHYALAFYYLSQKDKQNALYHLRQYAKANPNEKGIDAKIKEVECADIKVHHHAPPLSR